MSLKLWKTHILYPFLMYSSFVMKNQYLIQSCYITLGIKFFLWNLMNVHLAKLAVEYFQVNVTADHRIVYGADLAAFLQTFAKIVEDPDNLTL